MAAPYTHLTSAKRLFWVNTGRSSNHGFQVAVDPQTCTPASFSNPKLPNQLSRGDCIGETDKGW